MPFIMEPGDRKPDKWETVMAWIIVLSVASLWVWLWAMQGAQA